MERTTPTQIGPFTLSRTRQIFVAFNDILSESIARYAGKRQFSRAMKRLAARGLINRFGQHRDERVFCASCDLTNEGFLVAERLTNTLTVIHFPDTHPT